MLTIQFMTLTGKFRVEREQQFATYAEALTAVVAHATAGGYSHVQTVEDVDSIRYTARTPGGRGGRNIAYAQFPDF